MKNINTHQLDAFVTSAETGSFSAAARKMNKAHSAVSTAIANMEIDLGVELFDRSGRSPVLTSQGEILLIEAKQILARCELFSDLARQLKPGDASQISIVIDEQCALGRVEDDNAGFQKLAEEFPYVELHFESLPSDQVLQRISDQTADLGFVISQPESLPPQVCYQELDRFAIEYVCTADHPLARLKRVRQADLQSHRQVVCTNHGYSGKPLKRLSPNCWTTNSLMHAMVMVRAGTCWMQGPRHIIERYVAADEMVFLPVEDSLRQHTYNGMIWHTSNNNEVSTRMRPFLTQLMQASGESV